MLGMYFALLLGVATAISAAAQPRLVPSKRAITMDRRSFWKHDITPKNTMLLNYAQAPYYPPSATVSLSAQDGRLILLVEDFDYLLSSISCSPAYARPLSGVIVMDFSDEPAYHDAAAEWRYLQEFAVITSHPGCNPDDERGAWVVSSVLEDAASLRLTLFAEPVVMRDVIQSFGVKYNHNGGQSWAGADATGLSRRQEQGEDVTFNFGYSPSIALNLPLFPPNLTLNTGNNISQAIINQLKNVQMNLSCADCGFNTNITAGVDLEANIESGTTCTPGPTQNCFTLNSIAMNVTIEQFELDAILALSIASEIQAGQNYKVFEIPVGPRLNIPSVIDIGPAVGLEIVFELDISSSIDFTFGAKGQIPSGAFASVNLVNSTGHFDPTTIASGWNQSGVEQVPLQVDGGLLNISTSVALAPYVELAFTILDVGATLRIIENLPRVDVDAGVRRTVNRNCSAIGTDDFESFDTAFFVGAGMTLSSEAQFTTESGAFIGSDIPNNWDFTLFSLNIPLLPTHGTNDSSCFVLSDDNSTITPTNNASRPAPTGTLLAATSAVPTWDFNKIESFSSANGHLPTNVDYTQMLQATTVPSNLQSAITHAASVQSSSASASASQTGKKKSASAGPLGPAFGGWIMWTAASVAAGMFVML